MADALMIERSEVTCVLAAEAKGELIHFRSDTTPQSI
jgi:hypothetical protein